MNTEQSNADLSIKKIGNLKSLIDNRCSPTSNIEGRLCRSLPRQRAKRYPCAAAGESFCAGGGGSQRKRPRRRPYKKRRMEGKIGAEHATAPKSGAGAP